MTHQTVLLQYMPNSLSAEVLRGRLQVAGIEAHIRGTASEIAFGIGAPEAFSKLRIEVRRDQLELARKILLDDQHSRQSAGDWRCGVCEEENDAGFEICWNCGHHRNPSDGRINEKSPTVSSLVAPESAVQAKSSLGDVWATDQNPYRPVILGDDDDGQTNNNHSAVQPIASEESVDDTIRNLFRLSCVSLMLLPTPLALYTVYRICTVPVATWKHPAARKRLGRYLIFNAVTTTLFLVYWST